MKRGQEQDWQHDSSRLKTEKVQLWSDGVMLMLISLEEAKQFVKGQKAFVISSQAIEFFEEVR